MAMIFSKKNNLCTVFLQNSVYQSRDGSFDEFLEEGSNQVDSEVGYLNYNQIISDVFKCLLCSILLTVSASQSNGPRPVISVEIRPICLILKTSTTTSPERISIVA